jgi:hypothetical protein
VRAAWHGTEHEDGEVELGTWALQLLVVLLVPALLVPRFELLIARVDARRRQQPRFRSVPSSADLAWADAHIAVYAMAGACVLLDLLALAPFAHKLHTASHAIFGLSLLLSAFATLTALSFTANETTHVCLEQALELPGAPGAPGAPRVTTAISGVGPRLGRDVVRSLPSGWDARVNYIRTAQRKPATLAPIRVLMRKQSNQACVRVYHGSA